MTHRNRCKKAFVLWTLPILLGAADVAAVRDRKSVG
jgi:hypothetical protein